MRLRLKYPWRQKVLFHFEWTAFLFAYDLYKVDPKEFNKLDPDQKFTGLCYGAYRIALASKKQRYISYKKLCRGLLRASKADNRRLAEGLEAMKSPDWLKKMDVKIK